MSYFDERAATVAERFFDRMLVHIEGPMAGRPFVLEPWQRAIVREVLGRKRGDGLRQYRKLYLEVPRGNGKSTFAAGLALYLLAVDGERSAKVYSAAADRAQAGIVFETAEKMVQASPYLARHIRAYRNKTMEYDASGSRYIVLSSDVGERRDEAFGDREHVLGSRQIGHDQRELVAADPRDMLGRAGAALQPGRDLHQEFVACLTAEPVVDLLEAIEIEQQHGEFLAGARQPAQRAVERLVEGDAVRQMRQRILPHRPLRLVLGDDATPELEGIDEHAAQQHRAVNQHEDGHQQIDEIAVAAEADGDADEDRRGEGNRGDRDGGEGEGAAGGTPSGAAGDGLA